MFVRPLWVLALIGLAVGCSNRHGGSDIDRAPPGGDDDTDLVDDDTDIDDDEDEEELPDCVEGGDASAGIPDCDEDCPIYVDITADPATAVGTIGNPFVYIQDAIDAAPAIGCDMIRVRRGTYPEHIDLLGLDLDIRSVAGPAHTTIQGDGTWSVVTIASGESSAAILEGFTITGGGGDIGGGLYIDGSDPVITGNVITDNAPHLDPQQGGGLFLRDSDAWILDNRISYNDAGYGGPEEGCDGGAIFVRNGAPVIEANHIYGNTAGDGAGIWLARSSALIINNLIADNHAHDTDPIQGGQGGGINVQIGSDDLLIAGNVIVGNTASTHGGGVSIYEFAETAGDPWVVNNTIAYNAVLDTDQGGGLVGWSLTRSNVINNIIYANEGTGVWLNETTKFSYNNVFGNTVNYAGAQGTLTGVDGNVSQGPGFLDVSGDWTSDDYGLRSDSPMRNAGDPSITNDDGSRSHLGATGGPFAY